MFLFLRTGYTGEDGFEIYGHQKQLLIFGEDFRRQEKKKVLYQLVLVHVIHFVSKRVFHYMVKNYQKIFHHLKQELALL